MRVDNVNLYLKTTLTKTPFDVDSEKIKSVERIIRTSLEYKKVIADKRINQDENYCELFTDYDFSDKKTTLEALKRLKVDEMGLDSTDHELLKSIIEKFNGGPVGIDALSSSIGEEVTTIEDVYEPYLLQIGLLKRTSRGRVVTDKAYEVLGIEKNK